MASPGSNDLNFQYCIKIVSFNVYSKIFCVEFQRYPLKLHTKYNVALPIYWKMCSLLVSEDLRAPRFMSLYRSFDGNIQSRTQQVFMHFLEMPVAMTRRFKTFITKLAPEWFFPCVNPHVCFEMPTLFKSTLANFADIWALATPRRGCFIIISSTTRGWRKRIYIYKIVNVGVVFHAFIIILVKIILIYTPHEMWSWLVSTLHFELRWHYKFRIELMHIERGGSISFEVGDRYLLSLFITWKTPEWETQQDGILSFLYSF